MSEYDKELVEYVMMFGRLDRESAIKWLEESTQWRLESES